MAENGGGRGVAVQGAVGAADEQKRSPLSMYSLCLKAFVKSGNNPELKLIRFLPAAVISDILHTVSEMTFTLILSLCLSD